MKAMSGSVNASNFRETPSAIPSGRATTRESKKPSKILYTLAKISASKLPSVSSVMIADKTFVGVGKKKERTNPV